MSGRAETTDDVVNADPGHVHVGIAEYAVTTDDTALRTSGLGSCVGVGLYDPVAGVAGLAHVMLPTADGDVDTEGKYADSGVPALIDQMVRAGAERSELSAKIAGGSSMLETTIGNDIGEQNVVAVEAELERAAVPILGTDVGGVHGRSIELDPTTGDVRITSAHDDEKTI